MCPVEFRPGIFAREQAVGVFADRAGHVAAGIPDEFGSLIPGQRGQDAGDDESLAVKISLAAVSYDRVGFRGELFSSPHRKNPPQMSLA